LAGTQAAQMWRKEDERPKALLPKRRSIGTVRPIIGPATYQAQGCFNNSNIFILKYIDKYYTSILYL
jgi:hypothetical protein